VAGLCEHRNEPSGSVRMHHGVQLYPVIFIITVFTSLV